MLRSFTHILLILKSDEGEPQAKLARLVYRMLRYGMKHVDQGAAFYQAQHRHSLMTHLKSQAVSRGYQVTPNTRSGLISRNLRGSKANQRTQMTWMLQKFIEII